MSVCSVLPIVRLSKTTLIRTPSQISNFKSHISCLTSYISHLPSPQYKIPAYQRQKGQWDANADHQGGQLGV